MSAIENGEMPRESLCVGPAGTGKTFSVLWMIHEAACAFPGLRILIVRQTRVSLSDSVMQTFERDILPAYGMDYGIRISLGAGRRNRTSYRYPNGTEIVLGGMDRPDRIASTSWDIVYVNEAIELEEDGWDMILSRMGRPVYDHVMRRPGPASDFGWLIGDTNPGDPSHWLKRRCDQGVCVLWDTTHRANPALYDEEKGDWTPTGRSYLERLGHLRGTRRKRLMEGLWAAGEGQWFETFGEHNISVEAEYSQFFPVYLAVDSGVHTGAVWFQVRWIGTRPYVTVFCDYYSFNLPAYDVALGILEKCRSFGLRHIDRKVTDPAGRSSTAIGPTVLGEYARAGLDLDCWPMGSVVDGLGLVESFVSVDPPGLLVHPRCQHLRDAFANYKRAKRQGQWIDRPEDPQHPYEDMMDALRGGLKDKFPDGRRPDREFRRVPALRAF